MKHYIFHLKQVYTKLKSINLKLFVVLLWSWHTWPGVTLLCRVSLQQSQMAEQRTTSNVGATGNRSRITSSTMHSPNQTLNVKRYHPGESGFTSNQRLALGYHPTLDLIDNPQYGLLLFDNYITQTKRHYQPYVHNDGSGSIPSLYNKFRESGFYQLNCPPKPLCQDEKSEYQSLYTPHPLVPRLFVLPETIINVGQKQDSGFTKGEDLQINTFTSKTCSLLEPRFPHTSVMKMDFPAPSHSQGSKVTPKLSSHSYRETGYSRGTSAPLGSPSSLLPSPWRTQAPSLLKTTGKKEPSGFLHNAPNHRTFPLTPLHSSHFLTHYGNVFGADSGLRPNWMKSGYNCRDTNRCKCNQNADTLSRQPGTSLQEVATGTWGTCLPGQLKQALQGMVTQATQSLETFLPQVAPADLRELQQSDPAIQEILTFWQQNRQPTREERRALSSTALLVLAQWDRLVELEGLLYRQVFRPDGGGAVYQLLLPKALVQNVLTQVHQEHGHQGIERTLALLCSRCYWPGMSREVAQCCQACERCQHAKDNQSVPHAFMGHLLASQPNEILAIDFTLLEQTSTGLENVLVMTDVFSKYTLVVPTRNKHASTVAQVLVTEWFAKFGVPARIHSD
ncbi:uncharacterized protein saxo4 [Eucyclogobius newberryi]|uniref:uncharacterized protein saxo4 n=1 Tax=Eucyclogobius newberryi TaxID=166745 RepID=UPI003B5BFB35